VSWTLRCAWCPWYILVGDRGAHGSDQGAGVEAADLMEQHVADKHGHTWAEYCAAQPRQEAPE
jgi:hypothetical protein